MFFPSKYNKKYLKISCALIHQFQVYSCVKIELNDVFNNTIKTEYNNLISYWYLAIKLTVILCFNTITLTMLANRNSQLLMIKVFLLLYENHF